MFSVATLDAAFITVVTLQEPCTAASEIKFHHFPSALTHCHSPIFFCCIHFWPNPLVQDGPVTFTHQAGVTTQSEQWKTIALEQQRELRLNRIFDNTDSDSPPQYVQHHVRYSANVGTHCECLLLLAPR